MARRSRYSTPPPKMMRILVVDDDIHQLNSIKRYLNASGFSVITCGTTEEAIIALEGIPFDTVLSDIQMPQNSGISLIKWITEHHPRIPVFAMTAFGSDEVYRDVIEYGAVVYLEKPVDLKLLVQLLATSQDSCGAGHSFVTACLEAASTKGCGEVIVHNANQIGQIFFHQGKIAWAAVQNNNQTFLDILRSSRTIEKPTFANVIQTCKAAQKDVFSALIDEKYIKPHELRAILHRYLSQCFVQCLLWKDAKAMFIPSTRRFSGKFIFELVDILTLANTTKDIHRRQSSSPPK
ncbi:MAG: response regulator [Deltaproteobacteria bacterium]|nr:response regulator [Deltaproteobacteria bacterium]MBN2673639.1 response regulator [Deltaproteobacteria bacterium]